MDQREAKLKAQLGGAIRQARTAAGLSQKALAEAVGVEQAQMSRYERGEYLVALDTIMAIDRACKQPLGHVLRLAGIVEDSTDIASLLRSDPRLRDPRVRDALSALYEMAADTTVDEALVAVTGELEAASKAPGRRRRTGGPAQTA